MRKIILIFLAMSGLLFMNSGCHVIYGPKIMGWHCEEDSDCSSYVEGAYCSIKHFCSKVCSTHTDCGCKKGMTNQEARDGKCPAICVALDENNYCMQSCKTDDDCYDGFHCYKSTVCIPNN